MPCVYCEQGREHPLFVYLISDREFDPQQPQQRISTYVGITRWPQGRLASHNRIPGFARGPKTTRRKPTDSPSGRWILQLVVGPFFQKGKKFKDQVILRRKFMGRVDAALRMAADTQEYGNLSVYTHNQAQLMKAVQQWRSEKAKAQRERERERSRRKRPRTQPH